MTEDAIQFGYYPEKLDMDIGDISISTLSNLDESTLNVNNEKDTLNDWVYAPLQQRNDFGTNQIVTLPYSARVFALPKTHELKHKNSCGSKHLEFLIWTLGFFVGMRLTTAEAGFLDSTPIKKGKLVDFCLLNNSLEKSIKSSERFWQEHKSSEKGISRINGIIHALFMAQNPQSLQFEQVLMLYTALDACYACVKETQKSKERISHAKRIAWMCDELKINTPDWGAVPDEEDTKGKSELSIIRNDSIHEALFFNQPLGFSVYGGNDIESQNSRNVPLEMQALICRILVCLLAGSNDYTKSNVNTRQIFGLNINE